MEFTDKKIGRIRFSLFSPEMIRNMSAVNITVPDTYNEDGYPIEGGLVDPHLGVIDPGLKCKTCGGRMGSCPGHFGHIELVRPVVHPEFAKIILYVLRSTCPKCHRILLSQKDLDKLKDQIDKEERKQASLEKQRPIKLNIRKMAKCPVCGEPLPEISLLRPTTFYKNKQVILPIELREWLEGISNEDLKLLGFDPIYARPEWAVLTVLPVPPVNVRPSITLESGDRSEDDLTHKLVDIIRINKRLDESINAGAPQLIIEDLWELLQYHVTTYFNNEMPNIPAARHRSGRALKTLTQRIKGKEGRFRYNLTGKRVNFSARTVVSPDTHISIDEVGVPQEVANELTVPVVVTPWNIELCKSYIMSDGYPKANYVILPDGHRLRVNEKTRDDILMRLVIGSVVERTLMNGDIVLFNRQPSLHRISMMCHEVRIMPGKTFKLNPIVCAPYNADFDGDEMNLHVMQTIESRVEAMILMKVHNQILSPRHGHALITPDEDNITGAFYQTFADNSYDKEDACHLMAVSGIYDLPKPDKKDRFSGKILFSVFIPKELSFKERTKFYPYPEGEVVIKNGVLLEGAVEKKIFSSRLPEYIFHHHGPEATKEFLNMSSKQTLCSLTWEGFSLSLRNYEIDDASKKKIAIILDKMKREVDALVIKYKNKTLERLPGMGMRETLETMVMSITSNARNKLEKVVTEGFGYNNPSVVVGKIGARGSLLNTVQMSAAGGQQSVRNKRLNRGYLHRLLPHFKNGDLGAEARGFIFNNFFNGLKPTEVFFQAMGGRDSLVNTAIRTARSGYMQRRLIHALEDLTVKKDLTVRDANSSIIQTVFGGDKQDPMYAQAGIYVDVATRKDDTETV